MTQLDTNGEANSQLAVQNAMFAEALAAVPDDFGPRGIVQLRPNAVAQYAIHVPGPANLALRGAISVTTMPLCEIHVFRQLPVGDKNGNDGVADEDCERYPLDDPRRYTVLEFLVPMPDARIGVEADGAFVELDVYRDFKFNSWKSQVPTFHGQQMAANDDAVAQLLKDAREVWGWSEIDISGASDTIAPAPGTDPNGPNRFRRLRVPGGDLGRKVPDELLRGSRQEQYINSLNYRMSHDPVELLKLTVTSSTGDRGKNGFKDFTSALMGSIQQAAADSVATKEGAPDEAKKAASARLLSSLTGVRFDERRQQRYPVRAGAPAFTTSYHDTVADYSFWSSSRGATGETVPAAAGAVEEPF